MAPFARLSPNTQNKGHYLVFTPRPVGPEGVLSSPSCAVSAAAHTLLATTPTWCNRLNSLFIQTFNPSRHFFYPRIKFKVKFKKNIVTGITWKIIIGSLQFSTRSYPCVWRWPLFFDLIFFYNFLEIWYIYRFLGSASLLALSVFACIRKRGYGGHLYFLNTKFLGNAITWKIIIGSLQSFMWCCPWIWRWPD